MAQNITKARPRHWKQKKRNDERLRTGLGMTYQLSENWSLETAWQYTNNISSSKLYEYDQHLFTMGAAWTF